jgi:hypothetical protein
MQLKVIISLHSNITVFWGVTPCILEVRTFRSNLLPQIPI